MGRHKYLRMLSVNKLNIKSLDTQLIKTSHIEVGMTVMTISGRNNSFWIPNQVGNDNFRGGNDNAGRKEKLPSRILNSLFNDLFPEFCLHNMQLDKLEKADINSVELLAKGALWKILSLWKRGSAWRFLFCPFSWPRTQPSNLQ